MFYPHMVPITSTLVTGTASASALTGSNASPIALAVDHAGPGILFYGMEVVSAGDASAGGGRFIFQYTSRDGTPITASGGAINWSSVSNSASGHVLLNLASNSTLGYWLSCTAAVSGAANPVVRYWLTYLGGDPIGSSGLGMVQG